LTRCKFCGRWFIIRGSAYEMHLIRHLMEDINLALRHIGGGRGWDD